jgi:hypothetical protein
MPVDDYEREINEKRRMEGEKLLFDVFKHLTTLSTGSILVMIALLEKLFKENVHWKQLVLVSFAAFIISIGYAVNSMSGIGLSLRRSELTGKAVTANMLLSLGAFAVGIFSFMAFALKNL